MRTISLLDGNNSLNIRPVDGKFDLDNPPTEFTASFYVMTTFANLEPQIIEGLSFGDEMHLEFINVKDKIVNVKHKEDEAMMYILEIGSHTLYRLITLSE